MGSCGRSAIRPCPGGGGTHTGGALAPWSWARIPPGTVARPLGALPTLCYPSLLSCDGREALAGRTRAQRPSQPRPRPRPGLRGLNPLLPCALRQGLGSPHCGWGEGGDSRAAGQAPSGLHCVNNSFPTKSCESQQHAGTCPDHNPPHPSRCLLGCRSATSCHLCHLSLNWREPPAQPGGSRADTSGSGRALSPELPRPCGSAHGVPLGHGSPCRRALGPFKKPPPSRSAPGPWPA